MKRKIALLLKVLAVGTCSLFIAACYGVMMEFKRIIALSPEKKAIPDLNVSVYDGPDVLISDQTDQTGTAYLPGALRGMKAVITDTDGDLNQGSFLDKEITLDAQDERIVEMSRK